MDDKCPKCGFTGEMFNATYYPEGTIKQFKCPNCFSFVHYDRLGKRYYVKSVETGKGYITGAVVSFFLGLIMIAYGIVSSYLFLFFGGGFLMIGMLCVGEFLDKKSKFEALQERMKEKMADREKEKRRAEMLKTRVRVDENEDEMMY